MSIQNRQEVLQVGSRSLDLPDLYYPRKLPLIYADLMPLLKEMTLQGGIVVIPADRELERASRILLSYLAGRIRQKGVVVRSDLFGESRFLRIPDPDAVFWFMHNGFCFTSAEARLEEWLRPGRAAIVVDHGSDFSRILYRFPARICNALKDCGKDYVSDFEGDFARELEQDMRKAESDPGLKDLLAMVSAADQWGVPLPADLAGKAWPDTSRDFDALLAKAQESGLVFQTRDGHALTSKGPPWARACMEQSGFDEQAFYQELMNHIDLESPEQRNFSLALFQSWISRPAQRLKNSRTGFLTRKTVAGYLRSLWARAGENIFSASDVYEVLDWCQTAAELSEYAIADQMAAKALELSGDHPHLIHHRGHLLLELASRSGLSRDISRAEKALRESAGEFPGNVYVRHSLGLFEARFGKKQKARDAFEAIMEQQPWNAYAHSALADLYLDMGRFEQAEKVLARAGETMPGSICLNHLQGRLLFYQGNFAQAEKIWKSMLNSGSSGVYALQSLGHMARKRGRWSEAAGWLDRAWEIDPENSPVLLEAALIAADMAGFLRAAGKSREAAGAVAEISRAGMSKIFQSQDLNTVEDLLAAALNILDQALDNDPLNLRLRIQKIVICIRAGRMDQADRELSRLETSHPGHVQVLEARARWQQGQGLLSRAVSSYRQAAAMDRNNAGLILKLAGAAFQAGHEQEAAGMLNDVSRFLEAREAEIPAQVRMSLLVEYAGLAGRVTAGLRMSASAALEKAAAIDPENPWTRIYD